MFKVYVNGKFYRVISASSEKAAIFTARGYLGGHSFPGMYVNYDIKAVPVEV